MKIVFGSTTLVDDTASPRIAGVIEELGGQDVVQVEPLYGSANPAIFPRGNASGQFVFTANGSYASYDAATTAYKAAYALIDTQGTLVLTPTGASTVTLTMAGAILKEVQRADWNGVQLQLRYTFEITTIT